jgi:hypothetical protein
LQVKGADRPHFSIDWAVAMRGESVSFRPDAHGAVRSTTSCRSTRSSPCRSDPDGSPSGCSPSRQQPRSNRHYVFGEFAKSFANDGRLFYLKKKSLVRKNGKLQKSQIAEVRYPADATSLGLSLLGFGQGGDGELYLLGNSTAAPAGGTGVVVEISEP